MVVVVVSDVGHIACHFIDETKLADICCYRYLYCILFVVGTVS